jgi:hypothetical protein
MKSDEDIRQDVIREIQWDPQVTDPAAIGWLSRTARSR